MTAEPVIAGQTETFIIETKLFDLATERPVYTAVSESFAPSSKEQVIAELVPLVVKDLEKRGMIVKK